MHHSGSFCRVVESPRETGEETHADGWAWRGEDSIDASSPRTGELIPCDRSPTGSAHERSSSGSTRSASHLLQKHRGPRLFGPGSREVFTGAWDTSPAIRKRAPIRGGETIGRGRSFRSQ